MKGKETIFIILSFTKISLALDDDSFNNSYINQSSLTNEISTTNPKRVKVYWNIPTFQCDTHKLNFTNLAEKYDLKQNGDDRFRGDQIAILYDPGNFPAILSDPNKPTKTILRNGGVPQEGNLTLHIDTFTTLLNVLIPSPSFSGLAIIDFESWRPIFRQNFGILTPYKDLSFKIERKMYPLLPKFIINEKAQRRFEFHARKFMEETIAHARLLRPKATWGYYAYPYCFNMSPNNMQTECPTDVINENNRIDWLFKQTDNLHPSLYLNEKSLSSKQKVQMIEGRVQEAHRIARMVQTIEENKQIIPYFWYKYSDSRDFLTKDDLFISFLTLSTLDINGLVLWGSSNDVNTKQKCIDLYNYIDQLLGPTLENTFYNY